MRALAVTPIHLPEHEIARRQARYDRLAPPGLWVELRDVGPTAPTALDDEEDVRRSERAVTEVLTSTNVGHAGYDIVFPDCVLDPGVPARAASASPRVHGLLKLAAGHLAASGERFGAVVRNEAIATELDRRLKVYGLADYVAGIAVLDLPFEAIADTAAWNAALARAVEGLASSGAGVVLNGCSAVDVDAGPLPARVVDPTALALRLLTIEHGSHR
ncbi:aspartate/glutamate racemase family protein [Saccharomonospora viridis]|jgi:Asp/Glu/hydantoin racemase|uniref:Hydantoin racemase n=1 Tax=Saccharomonospora viridis TaxID=1852 RepID=A0A837D646_9PSEU|nr:aspartate/glutamate racemase family protein [Saccharomonospora viridis]KHF43080.1 hypothetical protein MINT15_32820 [Saccharomonospora viridis]SFO85095.1 Asp/Glu/hydantoin racemase [Saccharomonospora viridis]